jgi:protein-disulfide isomerase
VTITYKQFPLTNIHKNAERDALAAICSSEQWQYMKYKKALYDLEGSKNGAKVSDDDRMNAWKDILDTAKLAECLKADRYLGQVRAEMKEWDALGVSGTPTVFIDGKKLDNSVFRDTVILRTLLDRWLEVPVTGSGTVKK